jgi:hypothetical protein
MSMELCPDVRQIEGSVCVLVGAEVCHIPNSEFQWKYRLALVLLPARSFEEETIPIEIGQYL